MAKKQSMEMLVVVSNNVLVFLRTNTICPGLQLHFIATTAAIIALLKFDASYDTPNKPHWLLSQLQLC